MAKQRKTRQQKQLSDLRQTSVTQNPPLSNQTGLYSYSFQPTTPTKTTFPSQASVSTNITTNFVITDLRKTLLTTLAIILAQIVLKFFIHHS